MYHYCILLITKIIDNIISTEKTILTQKNKAIGASIRVVISQFIFYLLIKEVAMSDDIMAIIVVSLASGIGSYIAFYINKKMSKDMVYINIITSNNKDKMKEFGDYMRSKDIKIVTMATYNDDIEKTLTALVFANTKEQSSQIDKYLGQHDGFYREVVS